MSDSVSVEVLDDEQRTSHLVMHLARLVQRGATIVEQHGLRAVVQLQERPNIVPNIVIAVAGLALFAIAHQVLFLASTVLALYGWQRKRETAAVVKKVLVRVDEIGRVSECQIGAASRSSPSTLG
ncbi:MAG: hypothetical protein H7123_05500 [Thermoleophilia bacterium]|nr:hypothetical protein [Thermoleophilia bacterium]